MPFQNRDAAPDKLPRRALRLCKPCRRSCGVEIPTHENESHDSNRNGTVALANYVFLDHILDKSANLDTEYAQVVQRSKEFGADSAYEGVILLNYSQYLVDRGRYLDAATNKVHAWRIFAQMAKAEGAAISTSVSEPPGQSAPIVGK